MACEQQQCKLFALNYLLESIKRQVASTFPTCSHTICTLCASLNPLCSLCVRENKKEHNVVVVALACSCCRLITFHTTTTTTKADPYRTFSRSLVSNKRARTQTHKRLVCDCSLELFFSFFSLFSHSSFAFCFFLSLSVLFIQLESHLTRGQKARACCCCFLLPF